MKKVLFLLVALLGVAGMANAAYDTRTFNIDYTGDNGLPLYLCSTGSKTSAFYVKYGPAADGILATIQTGATAYVTDGDGKKYTADITQDASLQCRVTMNPNNINDIKDATKLTLTITEGSFIAQANNGTYYVNSTISQKIDKHLITWSDATDVTFNMVQKYELRTFTKEVSATGDGDITVDYSAIKSANSGEDLLGYSIDGSKVTFTVKYSSFIGTKGTKTISIPQGAIKSANSAECPAFKIICEVKPQAFNFEAMMYDEDTKLEGDNKDLKVLFTFYDPAVVLPAGTTETITQANSVSFDTKAIGKVIVIDGEEHELSDVTYQYNATAGYASYIATLPAELTVGTHTMYVNADTDNGYIFAANNKEAEVVYGTITVNQAKDYDCLKITSLELEANDFDEFVDSLTFTLEMAEGVKLVSGNQTYPATIDSKDAYITNTNGSSPTITSIQVWDGEDGKQYMKVILDDNLDNNGDYHLVFKTLNTKQVVDPKDPTKTVNKNDYAFAFMGDDDVEYYLAQDFNIILPVEHLYRFYDKDNEDGKHYTREADLTLNDYYDRIEYKRTFGGVNIAQAWVAPFTFTPSATEGAEGLTFKRITGVTNDEGSFNIHYVTLKDGEKVYANKPYVVESANKNVTLEITGLEAMFVEHSNLPSSTSWRSDTLYSATTNGEFWFIPTCTGIWSGTDEVESHYAMNAEYQNSKWLDFAKWTKFCGADNTLILGSGSGNIMWAKNNGSLYKEANNGSSYYGIFTDEDEASLVKPTTGSGDKWIFGWSGVPTKSSHYYWPLITPWRFYIDTNITTFDNMQYAKFNFVDDDAEATGINTVNTTVNTENDVMYNVAGQRVTAPAKGQVVIMNGKKHIVK